MLKKNIDFEGNVRIEVNLECPKIISMTSAGVTISIGDLVESNGRFQSAPSFGVKGVVFDIRLPDRDGATSDIIHVRWVTGRMSALKFGEFNLSHL